MKITNVDNRCILSTLVVEGFSPHAVTLSAQPPNPIPPGKNFYLDVIPPLNDGNPEIPSDFPHRVRFTIKGQIGGIEVTYGPYMVTIKRCVMVLNNSPTAPFPIPFTSSPPHYTFD